jgi:hypothetical protein
VLVRVIDLALMSRPKGENGEGINDLRSLKTVNRLTTDVFLRAGCFNLFNSAIFVALREKLCHVPT